MVPVYEELFHGVMMTSAVKHLKNIYIKDFLLGFYHLQKQTNKYTKVKKYIKF